MIVRIGPHKSFIGTFQLADMLQKFGFSEDTCYALGERLSKTRLAALCEWVASKRKRKVKVVLHGYDTWSMDTTLTYVILPLLHQLKEQQNGHPMVDDEDVPETIRSYNAPPKEDENSWDQYAANRWDWVLDEMIWAFTQIHGDYDWESQYHTGHMDIVWKPCTKEDGNTKDDLFEMCAGPKDTHVFDSEGYSMHNERISNGTRLFGKYYRALWT